MIIKEANNHTFLSFLYCAIIHSDAVDFLFLRVALTTQQECIAATLSELFIAGCAISEHLFQSRIRG